MPVELIYNIKCDICPNVKVDGPWILGMDVGFRLAPIPNVQMDDWQIVDYRVVCPKHKVRIFKGHAHHKKVKIFSMTEACRDNHHTMCSGIHCMCPCHITTKPRDSL